MRHRRIRRPARRDAHPGLRAAQARVPRLRLRGHRDASRTATSRCAAASASSTTSRRLLREQPLAGTPGIGHTRWATHGRPSEQNAHPHRAGKVVVIHNGIIENYLELRAQLAEPRPHDRVGDRHRGHLAPDRRAASQRGPRPRRGHAPRGPRSSRARTRSSCMSETRARRARRRQERDADRHRPRRRRELRRVRHPGDARAHPPTCSSSRTARWPS